MVFHPPVQIVAKAGDAGKYKTSLPAWNMILRGFMSGAYIAMGGGLATMCSTGVAAAISPGFGQLITGAVFPVGLIITVLTGAELFTGDAMLAPMAAFIHKISWGAVINLWIWVYIGNVIGSILYAYLMAMGPLTAFDAAGVGTVTVFGERALAIGWAKVNYPLVGMVQWDLLWKAIGCNWLVNLAVLLGICADDAIGKIAGIWFPIMAFVSSGLEHSIANIYFLPAAVFTQAYASPEQMAVFANNAVQLNWVTMWTNNIIMVTIGNMIGAIFFVAIIYWVAFRKEMAALK